MKKFFDSQSTPLRLMLLIAVVVGLAYASLVGALPPDALGPLGLVGFGMTTLAANSPRAYEKGDWSHIPVIASDIIYEGAAVGVVAGTGHARPLVAGDQFVGFANRKADNSAGAAAAINVEVVKRGQLQLAVSGAVITDIGQPVYASDDDTFQFSPVGGSFVGVVKRFVSSGIVIVEFDVGVLRDPWAAYTVRETISANKTLDAEDSGKAFFVDTDAVTVTLPRALMAVSCATLAPLAPWRSR